MSAAPPPEALKEKRNSLKHAETVDRSVPSIDDAAHPGSAGVLRAIGVGHFELKPTTEQADRSDPLIEAGTVVKPNPAPAVMEDIAQGTAKLRSPPRQNDRSAPQVERYPTGVTTRQPPQKAVVAELEEMRPTIEETSEARRKQSVTALEEAGFVRAPLVEEMKQWKPFIAEQAAHSQKQSVSELQKKVHQPLVEEVRTKRNQIDDFTDLAARTCGPETYRSSVHQPLVNEIAIKRPSIESMSILHRVPSSELTAGGD